MRYLLSFLLVLTLTACGRSGNETPHPLAGTPAPSDPSDPEGVMRQPPDTALVEPDTLPIRGTADYTGQLSLDLSLSPDDMKTLISPLELSVDFGAVDFQVAGIADDFVGYDGTVVLERGVIDRAAEVDTPVVAGKVSGTLMRDFANYLITGTFNGDFSGSSQDAMRGDIAGSVILSGVPSALSGSYQAARDPS